MKGSGNQHDTQLTSSQHKLQSENTFQNSEQRWADIINFLPDPTFVIDNNHRVIAWNHAMEDMTGLKAGDILGKGDYLPGEAIYGVRRPIMADLILNPNEEIEKSYSYVELDKGTLVMESLVNLRGKETFLWGKASLLYDSEGNITGAIESIRDITERKKAEIELSRLKKAVESSSNAILLTDQDGIMVSYCNESFSNLMGYSGAQINSLGGVVEIYNDRAVARDIYKTLTRGNSWQGEVELRTAGNNVIPATFLGDVVRDETGEIIGLFGVYNDITERKQAEMALKNSEQRLADIIDFLPDATCVIDKEHKVIAWNRAMEDMTGVKAQGILGKGNYEHGIPFYGTRKPILIDRILEPDEEMEQKYSKIIARDKEVLIVETPALMVRDKETFIWGKASLLYDSQGTVIGAIESMRDITERKQAEMALKNSEQRLAEIIEFLPDATCVIDKEHKVIAWNRAMEDMTGVKAREILGKGNYEHGIPFYGTRRPILVDKILEPDEEIQQQYSKIIERDTEVLIVETPALMVKGRETFLWGKASLLYDAPGNIIGAIETIRDVTDRIKAAQEKLENQEKVTRMEALASLGLMNAGLAHAIKQPLNSLMITIDSILYWYDQGKILKWEDLIQDLHKTLVMASRIHEIIEHMRAFIRNERYGEFTSINLNRTVDNAVDILKYQLVSHGVQIRMELDPDLPLVLGYENRLEEILINLIVNAMQSLDRASMNQDKIITCISKASNNVVLEICDNGAGINPEYMDKIFEPFFSTKDQGMGMGLFIAQSIITTLNGSIRCNSDKGRTIFRIELPPYRG